MKDATITHKKLASYSKQYHKLPSQTIIENAIIKNGLQSVTENRNKLNNINYTFSHEIQTGKITSQGSSSRCWIFAGLNVLRDKISKEIKIKNFELSQNYLTFYDKIEKANYFLENIIATCNEPVDSRIVMWLLSNPINEGGQWEMFTNLVKKYGVVPASVMPETYHSNKSLLMNKLLNSKLREYASILRSKHKKGKNDDFLRKLKTDLLGEFYQMLSLFLGEPPASFNFEYRNDEDHHFIDYNVNPKDFLKNYIKIDITNYISIINAPEPNKQLNKTYTVQYLGNVIDGKPILYLNLDIQTLKHLAIKQIKDKEPVWFGCDVNKWSDKDSGVMDEEVYNYGQALGVDFFLNKGEKLSYGDSLLTHAMVLTGVNLQNDVPTRWKVENSWGEKVGNNGFFVMSDNWFNSFNYQVVINKKHLSPELEKLSRREPIILPPWDPMGSLAIMK